RGASHRASAGCRAGRRAFVLAPCRQMEWPHARGSLILRQPPGRRETASSDCLAGGYQRSAPSGSGNPLRRRPYQPDGDRFRMDRRRFLQGAAALAGASFWRIPAVRSEPPATARLRLLVLGGTSYLGPALVREAVVAGHTVTLFNR